MQVHLRNSLDAEPLCSRQFCSNIRYECLHLGKLGGFRGGGLTVSLAEVATGDPVESCTILTTEANAVIGLVHDRAQAILQSEEMDDWLGGSGR